VIERPTIPPFGVQFDAAALKDAWNTIFNQGERRPFSVEEQLLFSVCNAVYIALNDEERRAAGGL
jgi:hypothetical protein